MVVGELGDGRWLMCSRALDGWGGWATRWGDEWVGRWQQPKVSKRNGAQVVSYVVVCSGAVYAVCVCVCVCVCTPTDDRRAGGKRSGSGSGSGSGRASRHQSG